jgi:hypothetical protein
MKSRMEMKLKMKMENNIYVGRDQSYLKYVFVFREICDIGIDTILTHFIEIL